ncbi:MAG: hypothetical protein ACRC14_03635 [Paracoccaceae bacterium]
MAAIDEIRDQDSLRALLKDRPLAHGLFISQRAALRALVLWGRAMSQDWSREAGLTALPVMRSLLTSGVACKYQPIDVKRAAAAVRHHKNADDAANATIHATAVVATAIDRANTTIDTATSVIEDTTSFASFGAARAATAATATDIFWNQIGHDALILYRREDLFALPLWNDPPPDWFTAADAEMREIWASDPDPHWAFWTNWWDGILSGNPVDWDLQHEIALIPDDVWTAGPAPVAKAIARLEERFDLKAQVTALKEQLREAAFVASSSTASPAHRSHNQPLELVEVEFEVRREITVVIAALQEVETELAKPAPIPSVLSRIGQFLLDEGMRIIAYCGSLFDIALKEAAKEAGAAAAKWGIPLAGAALLAQSEAIQSIGKGLLAYAAARLAGGG